METRLLTHPLAEQALKTLTLVLDSSLGTNRKPCPRRLKGLGLAAMLATITIRCSPHRRRRRRRSSSSSSHRTVHTRPGLVGSITNSKVAIPLSSGARPRVMSFQPIVMDTRRHQDTANRSSTEAPWLPLPHPHRRHFARQSGSVLTAGRRPPSQSLTSRCACHLSSRVQNHRSISRRNPRSNRSRSSRPCRNTTMGASNRPRGPHLCWRRQQPSASARSRRAASRQWS